MSKSDSVPFGPMNFDRTVADCNWRCQRAEAWECSECCVKPSTTVLQAISVERLHMETVCLCRAIGVPE